MTSIHSETSVARMLNILLWIAMGLLSIGLIVTIVFGFIMLIPSGVRADLLGSLKESGAISVDPSNLALTSFIAAIMSGIYLYVVRILHQIVKTLLAGDPFVPANISRLRLVWIVLALSEVIYMCITAFITMDVNGVDESRIEIRVGTWFLVFVIAALSEVFRHGAELRRDQELTV